MTYYFVPLRQCSLLHPLPRCQWFHPLSKHLSRCLLHLHPRLICFYFVIVDCFYFFSWQGLTISWNLQLNNCRLFQPKLLFCSRLNLQFKHAFSLLATCTDCVGFGCKADDDCCVSSLERCLSMASVCYDITMHLLMPKLTATWPVMTQLTTL